MPDIRSVLLLIEGNAASALQAIGEVDGALGTMEKEVGAATGALGLITAAVAGVAVGAAALAGVGAISVKMAGDFDASMTQIHTQAGAFDEDLGKMKDQIMAMSGDVATSPDKLAASLYHVESAGFRGAKAMDMVRQAAELAQIGHAGLERSTQAVIGVMAAYEGKNLTAAEAAAQLNAIVGTGDMRMEQLTAAMTTGIMPAAATFGLSLKDVGAALATMTDNVTPADEAATRLRMTFSLLGAPSGAAQKALGALGINATQLGYDMRKPDGLLVAIEDLKGHLGHIDTSSLRGGLDEAKADMEKFGFTTDQVNQMVGKLGPDATEQAFLISKAFGGGRSSAAIMTLLTEFDRFQSKYKAIDEQSQKFGADWKETQATFNFQAEQFRVNLDRVAITWGEKLMPVASRFLSFLGSLLPSLQNAGSGIYGALIPALNAFGDWFVAHEPQMRQFGQTIGAIFKQAAEIAAPMLAYISQHADMFKMALQGLGVVILLVVGIVAGLGLALIAVVAALVWTYENFKANLALLAAGINNFIIGAINLWRYLAQEVPRLVGQMVSAVGAFFSRLGANIHDELMDIRNRALQTWETLVRETGAFFNRLGTNIHNELVALREAASALWQGFIGLLTSGAQRLVATVVGWFQWLYNHNYYFKDLVNIIIQTFRNCQQLARDVWNGIGTFLTQNWQRLWGAAKAFAEGVTTVIDTNLRAALGFIKDRWDEASKWLTDKWNQISTFAAQKWNEITGAVQSAGDAAGNAVSDTWNNIWSTISSWASEALRAVQDAFNSIVDAVSGPLGNAYSSVTDFVSNAANTLSGLATQAWQWGYNAVSSFASGLKAAAGAVGDAIGGIAGTIAGVLGFHSPPKMGPARDSDTWMPNFINMLVSGLNAGAAAVNAAASGVISPLATVGSMSVSVAPMAAAGAGGGSGGGSALVGQMIINNPARDLDIITAMQRNEYLRRFQARGVTPPPGR